MAGSSSRNNPAPSSLDEDGTLQFRVLTLGQVSDVEYPPLTKTTMAYEFFATRYEYDLF